MSPVTAADRLASPLTAEVGETTAAGLDPDLGISDLIVGSGPLPEQVQKQTVSADLERKMDGASTLKITVRDPTRAFLRSPYVVEGTRAKFDGLAFRLASCTKAGDEVTLTFEDEAVWKLRWKKGPKKASRGRVTRAQFARSLCKEAKVAFVSPDAAKKQPIENEQDAAGTKDDDKKPGFAPGASITVKGKKADAAQRKVLSTVLAVGVSMDANRTVLLSSIVCVTVESVARNLTGGDLDSVGAFQQRASQGWPASRDVATDAKAYFERAVELNKANPRWTPGFLADAVQRSYTYGTSAQGSNYMRYLSEARKTLNAYNGSDEVDDRTKFEAQKKYEFTRGAPGGEVGENSWECITRLAREVNWRAYAHKARVYFVSDGTLMKARPIATLSESLDWIDTIDFDYELVPVSKRIKVDLNRATVQCRAARWAAAPGSVVVLEEMGPANGRWLVDRISRSLFSKDTSIDLRQPEAAKKEPAGAADPPDGASDGVNDGQGNAAAGEISTNGGARGIVEQAFKVAKAATGSGSVYVVSDYRPGDTVASGGPSDHAGNDRLRAARDIAYRGINALTGPPHEALDKGMAALGRAFDRDYGTGTRATVDTFNWRGYRIQIIWRTPAYGGHMGHIHIGAVKL